MPSSVNVALHKERTVSEESTPSSKISDVMGWAGALAVAYFVLPPALAKFTDASAWVARFEGWSLPGPMSYLIGVVEVVAVILLFVPRYASVGAGVLFVVMLGAAGTLMLNGVTFPMSPLRVAVLCAAIAAVRRGRFR